jgi:DNA mismatch repair protein MutL
MNRIKVLPPLLRNKIAAGEVIERPASVVKEILENSIDAGSTRIEITILGAGKKLIRVSDNGCGMNREDAMLAFERYATSKISEEDDLYRIRSMGFRGEALSSIASIAKVKLVTAPGGKDSRDGQTGVAVEISGGDIKGVKESAASGTIIEVKDIFFNTPARRKFLKTDATENYHIIDLVTREAMSHFNIGFILRIEGDDLLSLPPASSLRERLVQIYGGQFVDGLIETSSKDDILSVTAFAGKAANTRSNRNLQFLFVNRRPVRDPSINHAAYKAYEDIIAADRHPVFFLFLEIDPEKIDVNVHPAKREVRFEDKTGVYNFVFRTIREALKNSAGDFVSITPGGETLTGEYSVGHKRFPQQGGEWSGLGEVYEADGPVMAAEAQGLRYETGVSGLYICDTFLAISEGQGLTMLDFHAAHERINYERLLKKSGIETHRLLFPKQVKLAPRDYRSILDNLDLLRGFGMEIEDFGHGALLVRSLPEMMIDSDLGDLLGDVAGGITEGLRPEKDMEPIEALRRAVAARLACHSSIRGKREVPDNARLAAIIRDLDLCDEPGRCPHGRPTRIIISAAELKKMFRK